jgi:hypothetical protein
MQPFSINEIAKLIFTTFLIPPFFQQFYSPKSRSFCCDVALSRNGEAEHASWKVSSYLHHLSNILSLEMKMRV